MLYKMAYGSDARLFIEIDTPTYRCENFNEKENKTSHKCVADLLEEAQEMPQIEELTTKQRATRRAYNVEKLKSRAILISWNLINMRRYYSILLLLP